MQLRCTALPLPRARRSLRDPRKERWSLKLTRHNGRAGKHGTYNPKHNDRSFEIANSEHIDPERVQQNIYWDCYNGIRSALQPKSEESLADTFEEVEKLYYKLHYTNSQVYDFFDYQLNTISMNSTRDMKVESVAFDESYITELDKGETVGLNYGKNCPRLNWATLGLPLGDLYMLGGFSGTGKTSFVFENMILPLTESSVKCCIISNEMQVRAYKQLLTIHILTNDLGYWKMTRKHLKVGKFTDEQKEMLCKAAAISQKKYSSIRFIKMFDNDT